MGRQFLWLVLVGFGFLIAGCEAADLTELNELVASNNNAPTTTHWVNDDDPNGGGYAPPGTSCNNPGYSTIQAAVTVAAPSDTVRVCPGTYAGGGVIDKVGLKLEGQGPPGATKIVGTGATGPVFGLTVVADDVRIRRFEITGFSGQHDASGIFVGGLFAGDTAHPADGAVITHNDIHDNGNGVYLWQSNDNRVTQNRIHDNKDFDGVEGTGILSFNGYGAAQIAAANAAGRSGTGNLISHNLVYGNDRLGIFAGACGDNCFESGRADLSGTRIVHNRSFGNGVTGFWEGIGLLSASGGAEGVVIAHNTADENGGAGIFLNASDYVRVTRNSASANQLGIFLVTSSDNVVSKNEANGNSVYDGITLRFSSDGNLIADNEANGNARDGIRVRGDPGGSGNLFEDNEMENNIHHDCHDDTTGGGTAGTANTWDDNEGTTSSPPGLCDDD